MSYSASSLRKAARIPESAGFMTRPAYQNPKRCSQSFRVELGTQRKRCRCLYECITVTRIHYNTPHATVRLVATKNTRVRSRYADSTNVRRREDYFRINRNTGSPSTMFVMWRKDPVNDMSNPPNDAYAVLKGLCQKLLVDQILKGTYTTSSVPGSKRYTLPYIT
jgi:hypothetical protein